MSELDPILAEIAELHAAKAKGYGRPGEAFHNIIEGAKFAGIAPWVAALLRAGDKMGRLSLAAQGNPASDESVEDNLLDLINYGCIALALWRRDHGPRISPEGARALLATDYPGRFHHVTTDNSIDFSPLAAHPRDVAANCARGIHDWGDIPDRGYLFDWYDCRNCPAVAHRPHGDPLKTEPGDWRALEHGSNE